MSRRSCWLWVAAVLVAAGPDAYYQMRQLLFDVDDGYAYAYFAFGWCPGAEYHSAVQISLSSVIGFPLFRYGGAPLIVLGFAGWYLCVRTGQGRIGRFIVWCTAGTILVYHVYEPALFVLDTTISSDCLVRWGPPVLLVRRIGLSLYHLAPPLLILLTLRSPGGGRARRGRAARVAVSVVTLTATLLLPTQSAPPGLVSTSNELRCDTAGDGTVKGLTTAERTFLCDVRGYTFSFHDDDGIRGWEQVADEEVLRQGRHLCAVATRHGGDIDAEEIGGSPHASLRGMLASLCPPVAQRQQAEAKRMREEVEAHITRSEKACAAHPAHRPRITPVRQKRAVLRTEFWYINGWDEGFEGTADPDIVEELVGGGRGQLLIWAADEAGHACVTVESYTRRPPLETKGWEEVVEVGYESPKGKLALVDGEGTRIPGLTLKGPGSYRVRVHLRGRKLVYQVPYPPDGAVQLLIMVYPGKEKKPIVYR